MGLKGQLEQKMLSHINLGGSEGPNDTVLVLIKDLASNVLFGTCTTIPTDGEAGYAKGCLLIDTDVAAATTGLYVNIGTTAACDFDAITDA